MLFDALLIIILCVAGILGDYFLELAGNSKKYMDLRFFLIGLAIYSALAVGWFLVMKHVKLADLGGLYALTTSLLFVGMGVFVFKEQLGWSEVLGVILGIISIALLAKFH
jgi:drug/metabolite transporter (DMT)-like permease